MLEANRHEMLTWFPWFASKTKVYLLLFAGDSACSIPPQTIPAECLEVVRDWTIKIAKELKVVGLINIQYCIQDNQVCMQCFSCQSTSAFKLMLPGNVSYTCLLYRMPLHRRLFPLFCLLVA